MRVIFRILSQCKCEEQIFKLAFCLLNSETHNFEHFENEIKILIHSSTLSGTKSAGVGGMSGNEQPATESLSGAQKLRMFANYCDILFAQ